MIEPIRSVTLEQEVAGGFALSGPHGIAADSPVTGLGVLMVREGLPSCDNWSTDVSPCQHESESAALA